MTANVSWIVNLRERAAMLRAMSQQLWQLARDIDDEIIEQTVADHTGIPASSEQPVLSRKALLAKAEAAYKERRRREKLLGKKLFGEPAWDMLLDLYTNSLKGRNVSTTSLCGASMVPNTTALRWIKLLEDAGLVEKTASTADARVQYLALSKRGYGTMTAFFTEQAPEERNAAADIPIFFGKQP